MELPKELAQRKWAQEYLTHLETLSDEKLFDEVFEAQVPDDYDGGFSLRGGWMATLSEEYLRERFLKK
jgi:hypothetical protein